MQGGIRPLILLFIAFLGPFICHGDDGQENDGLDPLDPARDIWQVKEGYPSIPLTWPLPGGLKRCRLPDPVSQEEFEEQLERQELRHKQEMSKRSREISLKRDERESAFGGVVKVIGWGLVVLGIVCHTATTIPLLKNWASSIITAGVGSVGWGLAIQKTVEFEKWVNLAFWLLVGGLAMYGLRNKAVWLPKWIKEKYRSLKSKE